jgi:hypothetical protein
LKRDRGFFFNIVAVLKILAVIFFISTISDMTGQWGIGIDAEPILLYLGNVLGGVTEVPNWTGSEGLEDGIDFNRYRKDKNDWIRYWVATHIVMGLDKEVVALLDDDLNPMGEETGIEKYRHFQTGITLGIEKEKWHGDGRLKRILSRGASISLKQKSFELSIVNPLEAYISDTLWFRSGYSLGLSVYYTAGLGYFVSNSLRVSGKLAYGLSMNNVPQGRLRKVERVGSDVELMQHRNESGANVWSIDTFIRPQITLTFYFDGRFF